MSKLDALWEYQAVELKKEAYEREMRNTPARSRLKKLHAYLTEQQSTLSRLQSEVEQKQAALEKLQERAEKLNNTVELERSEFDQMQNDEECTAEEMTECRENHEKLLYELAQTRKELTELIKWIESTVAEFKSTRQQAGKAKKEYDHLRAVCDEEYAKREEGLHEVEAELGKQKELVDPSLLERYEKVKRNHLTPMAKVENNQCGGCNMSLPMVVIKKVISSDSIVECDNCGRILYAK